MYDGKRTKCVASLTYYLLIDTPQGAHEVQLEFGENRLAELRARLTNALRTNKAKNIDIPFSSQSRRNNVSSPIILVCITLT